MSPALWKGQDIYEFITSQSHTAILVSKKKGKESHMMYDKLTFKFFEGYSYSVTK